MTKFVQIPRILIAAAVFGTLATFASCASTPERSSSDDTSGAPHSRRQAAGHARSGLAKTDWLAEFPDTLSESLCADGEIFRACYPISQDDCRQRARSVAEDCGHQYDSSIPSNLREADESHWGSTIGQCAGEKLNEALLANFQISESDTCHRALEE